jgi:hypothetical protein
MRLMQFPDGVRGKIWGKIRTPALRTDAANQFYQYSTQVLTKDDAKWPSDARVPLPKSTITKPELVRQ